MILSVSRRTDVPNYYSEWFLNRIKEGFLYVRNPMNPHQISKISLSPEIVDCIIFWTKNPAPMLDQLDRLNGYHYYFQFSLTGYGKDLEPNLPDKKTIMIETFRRLSSRIGMEKVIWRYDPIIITDRYTQEYHLKAFRAIASALKEFTERVVISFVDLYEKTRRNMRGITITEMQEAQIREFASKLAEIAEENDMKIAACAENIDLTSCGIERSSCIDVELIERIVGCKIKSRKDKNQRPECGCIESVDVGTYHTCRNGCRYCYANFSDRRVREYSALYDPQSPVLCGKVEEGDKITERSMKSLKEEQRSIFDVMG